ncbi:putative nuclease HARBI1, partial [Pseudolycoriella hygida]
GIPTKNWSVQNDEERYTRRLEEISRTVQTVVQTMKMGRFREMYRLPRSLALDFLNLVEDYMDGDPCPEIPKTIQFCAVLKFYASGTYQRRVGSDAFACMSQTLVSHCVRAYSFIIATKVMDQLIQFPQTIDEIKELHDEFQLNANFPGAFGIVDGSLIALAAVPRSEEHTFMSRKRFHAINAQFVIDINLRCLSVNARYPGSTHDSLVWRSSLVNSFLRQICNQTGSRWRFFMLADNGYPLQPWLLKPYDSTDTELKEIYNKNHLKLRSLVERAIGHLKGRFRCLLGENKLRYDTRMSAYIIYACSTLHNFLITNKYPVDDINPIFENEDYDFDEEEGLDIPCDELCRGAEVRNKIAEYFYLISD